jgi:hypothetical protein
LRIGEADIALLATAGDAKVEADCQNGYAALNRVNVAQ